MDMTRVEILGERFDGLSLESAADWILAAMRQPRWAHVCTVNVAIMMMARKDPELEGIIRNADLVVADGQPIVWAAQLLGSCLPERVGGVDLVDRVLARAARSGLPVYFLGAKREVILRAAQKAQQRHRGLIVTAQDGYFAPEEAPERAHAIRESGARLLLCGMGVPRQEQFLRDHRHRLGDLVAIGVGGTFEVMAGLRQRAPKWIQRAGLEWAVRLVQEPRRLWRRYFETNTAFLYELGRALIAPPRSP
jgi:N-acetylglucosaminyldiphosphoundecaprenol N-acetyl-beta-D-mannosaminyltransferase